MDLGRKLIRTVRKINCYLPVRNTVGRVHQVRVIVYGYTFHCYSNFQSILFIFIRIFIIFINKLYHEKHQTYILCNLCKCPVMKHGLIGIGEVGIVL